MTADGYRMLHVAGRAGSSEAGDRFGPVPFAEIVEAHRRVDGGHKVGSVVVTFEEEASNMDGDVGPYSTAGEMLTALDAGIISSVELVDMHLARIDALDADLNTIVVGTPSARSRRHAAPTRSEPRAGVAPCSGCRSRSRSRRRLLTCRSRRASSPYATTDRRGRTNRRQGVRGRRVPSGQDERSCLARGLAGRQSRVRPHQQPVGRAMHARRQHRRGRRRARGGNDAARVRQ